MYPPVYLRTFFQYIFICSKERARPVFRETFPITRKRQLSWHRHYCLPVICLLSIATISRKGVLCPLIPHSIALGEKKYGEESPLNCVKKQKRPFNGRLIPRPFFPSLRGEVGRVLVFFLSMTNFGNDFFPVLCTSYILDWLARVAVRRQELRQKRGKNRYSFTLSISKCWLDREWKTGDLRIKVPFASQNG